MAAGNEENPRMPLDKVIFVIACVYLGWVVAGLISQKNAPVSQNGTISPEDQKFIAYLQSSLTITESPRYNFISQSLSFSQKYPFSGSHRFHHHHPLIYRLIILLG
jgi:hypothetical protein